MRFTRRDTFSFSGEFRIGRGESKAFIFLKVL